jgi:DNA polymerase-3 subunit gamma/tau
MTVPNTIRHLKMVAEKEGITYEEEALNIIAEKADGGMRDALSIFDQAVSLCQGNITYQKVIEDLNVLDAENYFQIIDLAIENKVADIMVLLNNVINKGFDGGHLISGLASHVRNVLMAKDEQTISLLEVSQRQMERYRQQAKKCPVNFLYKALKIMNDCDINYRQSSNKRLLVELTLIQVAQITQEDDSPAAGRGPKRLKSLFRKLMKNAQAMVAAQGTTERHLQTDVEEHAAKQPSTPSLSTTIKSAEPKPAEAKTANAHPKVHLSSIGMTFANLSKSPEKPSYQKENLATKEKSEHQEFSNDMLLLQWTAMCNRMPQQMAGMAARMKNMTPTITTFPQIEVVIDNEILLKQMTAIQGRIRNTMAQSLHNSDITLSLRLAKADEVKKILNNRELLEDMRTKNPALDKLLNELEMELV